MTKPNAPINSIPDLNNHFSEWYGLTKREYFAAMAMQGILADGNNYFQHVDIIDEEEIGKKSVTIADALIKALN